MNNKAKPKLIGVFVTTSILLLVAMVLFFGSFSFLSQSSKFILFFDQSVNGLQVGSAVKFRGVPVGVVERIMIKAEGQLQDSTAIPVIISLNQSRLVKDLGVSELSFQPDTIHELIQRGLVGQLNLESFITGQLFVEFSFEPDQVKQWQPNLTQENEIVEIPALSSSLDQITRDVAKLISDASAIDLPRLNENVNEALENLTIMLGGIDSAGISQSLRNAADEVTSLVASDEFEATVASMRQAFDTIGATAKTLDLQEGPLGKAVEKWTEQFQLTLQGLDRLVESTEGVLKPDSTIRFELENTLRELSRAAQSLRTLADYLESNPSALIRGRTDGTD